MDQQLQASILGLAFLGGLVDTIGAEGFAEVCCLNADETDPGVCRSHDFCDANEVMAEAFETVVGRAVDLQSEDDIRLWNAAWRFAKACMASYSKP